MVRWPLLAALLPLLPLAVLLVSLVTPRQRQMLILDAATPVFSEPFRLQGGWLGSPRLQLHMDLPANSSVGLDVDLLTASGETVLQLSKEGWRERGTWRQDGESGTYDEGDAALVLALRPPASGMYRLQLVRQQLLGVAGQPLLEPLRLRLSVQNHSVDRGLLLITVACTAVLVRLLWGAVYGDCRLRRRQRSDEPPLGMRLDLGAEGLLRLVVQARYEEPDRLPLPPHRTPALVSQAPPSTVELELRLSDAWGRPLLQENRSVRLHHWSGSEEEWWSLQSRWHLKLSQPGSVRIQVAVPPQLAAGNLELEWLELLVEDGVVTPWLVAARPLGPARPSPGSSAQEGSEWNAS